MDLNLLRFSADTIGAIYVLQLEVEIHEGDTIEATESFSDLLRLLDVAVSSNDPTVRYLTNSFIEKLNADQYDYLYEKSEVVREFLHKRRMRLN